MVFEPINFVCVWVREKTSELLTFYGSLSRLLLHHFMHRWFWLNTHLKNVRTSIVMPFMYVISVFVFYLFEILPWKRSIFLSSVDTIVFLYFVLNGHAFVLCTWKMVWLTNPLLNCKKNPEFIHTRDKCMAFE